MIKKTSSINDRRDFIKTGIIAASAFALSACTTSTNPVGESSGLSENNISGKTSGLRPDCLDYGRSYLQNTGENNSVRMLIESRTTIYDLKSGSQTDYFQCAPCKSEDTFAKENLFYKDNYDFLPIFGEDKVLVFRSFVNHREERYRTISPMADMWGKDPQMLLPVPASIEELDTWEKIYEASISGVPIVTQTEIVNKELGLRAVIECPCKTLNLNASKKLYQTDNGPIALPDLSKRYEPQIDSLSLAFIAFNVPHFADFVVHVPTPIESGGKEIAKVNHYSKLLTLDTTNRLFAVS